MVRLKRAGIYGTQEVKTVEGARLNTICFDKTGTLTQQKMEIAKVLHFTPDGTTRDALKELAQVDGMAAVFGCCNSVQEIGGVVKGDEIDLEMFAAVGSKIVGDGPRRIRIFEKEYELLKINQY